MYSWSCHNQFYHFFIAPAKKPIPSSSHSSFLPNPPPSSPQSVSQFSHSVVSDSFRPHELQHGRPPCPSPAPGLYSNSCPWSWWCHPAISSSVVPFSSCPQSFLASGSFPMSQLFTWGGQSIGVSASSSVLPMNTQDWSPLGWTGWISLQSKGLFKSQAIINMLLFSIDLPIRNILYKCNHTICGLLYLASFS